MNVSITFKSEKRNGIEIVEKRNRFTLYNYTEKDFDYKVLIGDSIAKQSNPKKLWRYYILWQNSSFEFLSNCYNNYSYDKGAYYNECVRVCNKLNGMRPRIITFSKFVFTFGFIFEFDGSKYFVLITPTRCECINVLNLILEYQKYN